MNMKTTKIGSLGTTKTVDTQVAVIETDDGVHLLDIRQWYKTAKMSKAGEDWKPGKGVCLKVGEGTLKNLYTLIKQANKHIKEGS